MRLVSAARAFRNIAPSYPIFDTPRNASSAYARTEETRFGKSFGDGFDDGITKDGLR